MNIHYIDGQFVPADRAALPVDDLALLRGYGVFDFLRTYGGRPFKLAEHIARLEKSAGLIGLDFPFEPEEVENLVLKTLEKNPAGESNIRVILTGGPSSDAMVPSGPPRLLILVAPLTTFPPEWYRSGVDVITTSVCRQIPGAKTLNYIPALVALGEAAAAGAVEAVSVDSSGRVREGPTTTLFAFFGDSLTTVAEGILPGITRRLVLELVDGIFPVEIRDISKEELFRADEIFLTASNKEILPVVGVDGRRIGEGTVGERTRRVMDLFGEYTRRFVAGRKS